MRKLLPPILAMICLALMLLLGWFWPIRIFVPAPWYFLGILPMLVGFVLCRAGIRQIRRHQTALMTFGQPSRLITDGVFRFSRNPIYLGLAMILLGLWLVIGALSAAIPWLLFVVVADRWYIRFEEAMLAKTFGLEYEQYKSRTRRWI